MRLLCLQSLYCNQSRGSLNEGTQKKDKFCIFCFLVKKKREKGLHILGCMGTHTLTTKYPSFQFVARAQNNWRKSWDEDILYDLQVEESGSD